MKKNSGSQKRNRLSTRKLRLESLENRELLTATPWDSGAADIEVAAAATVPDEPVDVSDVAEALAGSINVYYDSACQKVNPTWKAIPGALTYQIHSTSVPYSPYLAGVTTNNSEHVWIYNIQPGKSYTFKVTALGTDGKQLGPYYQRTFAPISIDAITSDTYTVGKSSKIELIGASNAKANYQWYEVTAKGDVAIPGATGLTYKPQDRLHDLKVVATGIGVSAGSSASYTFKKPTAGATHAAAAQYDADAGVAQVDWKPMTGATKYSVVYSYKDANGSVVTKTAAKNIVGTSYVFNKGALNSGKTYTITVKGYKADNTLVDTSAVTFAPVKMTDHATTPGKFTVGKPVQVYLNGSTDAVATIKWIKVDAASGKQTTLKTETNATKGMHKYTPEKSVFDDVNDRLIVTVVGVDDSVECVQTPLEFANASTLKVNYANGKVAVDWSKKDTVIYNAGKSVADATKFQIQVFDGAKKVSQYTTNNAKVNAYEFVPKASSIDKTYTVKVVAVDDSDASKSPRKIGESYTADVTVPAKVDNVVTTRNVNGVTVDWTNFAATLKGKTFDGYKIKVLDGGVWKTKPASYPVGVVKAVVSGVAPGDQIKVVALSGGKIIAGGESDVVTSKAVLDEAFADFFSEGLFEEF